jgi:uncharacterized protein (TIGR02145 family)
MASTTGWNSSPSTGVPGNDQSLNNSSGFNVFPDGFFYNGESLAEGEAIVFWSSTESDTDYAWFRSLSNNTNYLSRGNDNEQFGFSVRFVRD